MKLGESKWHGALGDRVKAMTHSNLRNGTLREGFPERGGFWAEGRGLCAAVVKKGKIPGAGWEPLFSPTTLIHHYLGIFQILAKLEVGRRRRGDCKQASPIPMPSFLLAACN